MESDIKNYIKRNALPITAEVILIISLLVLSSETHIYANTMFYLLLLIYVIKRKDFSIKEWSVKLKSGKEFWKNVLFTVFGFIAAVIITMVLEKLFPSFDTGAIKLTVNNWPTLLCFTLSTVLLPAITEETVFRKNMISLDKQSIVITTVISMVLFSVEHYLKPWGILLGVIWALPLTVSYIRTKDIYIPMTAHVLVSLLGNGIDIVNLVQKLS